jgi:hypothetical protein
MDDIIQIESIKVSPDPPKPGQDLTVTVKGAAIDVIEVMNSLFCLRRKVVEGARQLKEGAYADVTVKLGLIKLVQKRFDVCEEA